MNFTPKIFIASVMTAAMTLLCGCSALQKAASNNPEGRIVTLADGRKVVVKGTTTSTTNSSSSQKPDDKVRSTAENTAKSTKKEAAKAKQQSGKKLTPPKDKKEKKEKKNKKTSKPANDRESIDQQPTTVICADPTHLHNEANTEATPATPGVVDVLAAPLLTVDNADEFNINGEWTIYSVRGNLVGGEERPYVTFDLPSKRFYGNNGCNYINGDLEVAPGRELKFTNVISTMKMCQDDQYQYLINLALNDVVKFVPRFEKPITYLDLKDATGRVILVLRRHNMDFLNGAWKVELLNDTPLLQDDEATMTFDTSDLKIHGTTGCNIFNGDLFIDPDKTNSLQIIHLATTKMMCAPNSRETEFLVALEDVETAKALDSNTIILSSPEGTPLFRLSRMELREN